MKRLVGMLMITLFAPVGCAVTDPPDTAGDAPVIKEFKETSYEVRKKANEVGQGGVTYVRNVGDQTGVNKTVTGISEVIVDTSEEIGQEQKGELFGADVSLFPPQAENDGKVLRVDF